MKKFLSFILCLSLLLAVVPAARAEADALPKVVDEAGLLTQEEIDSLEAKAQSLADRFQIDVVILTVWSLGGASVEAYADDYFDYNYYGIGSEDSGVLFMLSMEYRDWAISTKGDGIYAVTDYGVAMLFDAICEYLADDEFYLAFDAYLDELEIYYQAFADGDPIDGYVSDIDRDGPGTYNPATNEETVKYQSKKERLSFSQILSRLFIALVIGAAAGGCTLLGLRRQMNTAVQQSGAKSYLIGGSYNLTKRLDTFLYSNVTKTRRSSDSSSGGHSGGHSGGGSSTHHSSSGSSHGGGHGKF